MPYGDLPRQGKGATLYLSQGGNQKAPYARWISNIDSNGATRSLRCSEPDPGARGSGHRGNSTSDPNEPYGAGGIHEGNGATRISSDNLLLTYDPSFKNMHGRTCPDPVSEMAWMFGFSGQWGMRTCPRPPLYFMVFLPVHQ